MIQIRSEQYEAMAKSHRLRFHEEILAIIRQDVPAEMIRDKTDAELLTRIDAAHTRANGRGIKGRSAVAKFAVLDIFAGPTFDQEAVVNVYLNRTDMTADKKLDLLYDQILMCIRTGAG